MNPFDVKAVWGPIPAHLYDRVVASGQDDLYRRLLDEVTCGAGEGDVLDVGCGPGHAAALLALRWPGARLTGLDTSREMITIAERRAARAGARNAAFRCGDALSLPFPDASFDLVYSIASLKHWSSPDAGIAEIHRVLRPGGRAAILEADRGARDEVVIAYARRWRFPPAPLTARWFRAFIAGNSLDPIDAAELMGRSPFRDHDVARLPDLPLFRVRARKADAGASA